VVWSPAAARDWHDFLSRLPAQLARYGAQRIAYADTAFAPNIDVDTHAALTSGTAKITVSNQAKYGAIHVTLDDSAPDMHAPLYSKPFDAKLPVTVRAATYADNGIVLASVRQRVLNQRSLLSLSGSDLPNCPSSDFRLRLQPEPDALSLSPVYPVNVFDACQLYPSATLDNVVAIHADVARLKRNFALAHDAKLVVSRPHTTPYGELVVHLDTCNGKTLASLPLPDPSKSDLRFPLNAPLPEQAGTHTLCLIFTAPIDGPLYAIGFIALMPADTSTTK
jgi:hexosaminidase